MNRDKSLYDYAWENAEELKPSTSSKQKGDKALAAVESQMLKNMIQLTFNE